MSTIIKNISKYLINQDKMKIFIIKDSNKITKTT